MSFVDAKQTTCHRLRIGVRCVETLPLDQWGIFELDCPPLERVAVVNAGWSHDGAVAKPANVGMLIAMTHQMIA